MAVSVDDAHKYERTPTVPGAQVVGLRKVRSKTVPTPDVGVNVRLREKKSRRRSAARQNARTKVLPNVGDVVDSRPLPDIPGPPVPKPVAGVWSDSEWSLLS